MKTKMKTKIRKSMVLTIGVLFLGLSSVMAQPGRGFGRGQGPNANQRQGAGMGLYASFLDLTEEQQASIADLRTIHLKKMTDLHNQMREKRARLNSLTTGDNYDIKEAESVIDEMGDIHTRLLKERTSHRQDVRNLLTEEQQTLFDARKGRRMGNQMGYNRNGRGAGRMGYGFGPGPCRNFN